MHLHEPLEYWARRRPDAEALTDEHRTLTFSQADDETARMAALLGHHARPGDRVAILADNCLEYLELYLAASRAGVVAVPLNTRLTPAEWATILLDCRPRVIVTHQRYCAGADAALTEAAVEAARVCLDGERAPTGWLSLSAEIRRARRASPVQTPLDHVVIQGYTSGTTGTPKGAMLSHAAVDASARRVAMAFNDLGGQRVLVVMPLHHVAATVQLAFLAQGCPLRILSRFEPEVVLRRLAEDACALTLLVPAMIEALLHAPNAAGARLPALRYLFYGASPIPERALREAMRAWPVGFVQGYGLTETCGLLTLLTPEDHRLALDGRTELLQSCGRPLAGTSVQVVGPDGAELAAGEAGEIVASGPQLMSGYFGQPDATREALRDGRLHTGDAGAFDADGYLFIRDRLKDMIVSGGENVYPREVEEALTQVPGIAEAAVIGVPHDRWGEAVKAVVRLQPGVTLSEEEIVQACRSRLGGYKLPKSVTFVDELPRNATGKVLKKVLREPYWRGHARAVN